LNFSGTVINNSNVINFFSSLCYNTNIFLPSLVNIQDDSQIKVGKVINPRGSIMFVVVKLEVLCFV